MLEVVFGRGRKQVDLSDAPISARCTSRVGRVDLAERKREEAHGYARL